MPAFCEWASEFLSLAQAAYIRGTWAPGAALQVLHSVGL